ncbi:MAG: hybrid sensor histidine kinase/response regulator [Maricaulaceae bacterium]|jgi:signal transduction histidine kinase/CheY-like chemotaxis protein
MADASAPDAGPVTPERVRTVDPAQRRAAAALDQAADPAVAAAQIAAAAFFTYVVSRDQPGVWTAFTPIALALAHGALALLNARGPVPHPLAVVIMFAAICGAVWSLSVFFFFPHGDPGLQLAAAFAVGGGALALAAAFHVHPPASFAAIAVPAPLFIVLLLIENASRNFPLAALFALLWLVLMWLSAQLSAAARARIALQSEKELLIENVAAKARELEAARFAEASARAEAEEANASKSRFLAHSSHDLRQPLHAIGLFLETLPAGGDDPEVAAVVDRVKQSLEVLSKLFDSLLDVTMLDTGQIEVKPQAFSAERLLTEVRDDFASVADACGVELRVAPTRLWLRSDPVIVRRIVQNLVSNAIRHADRGAVLIGARRAEGAIGIDVVDTGSGVRPEDRARIFQEFTKIESEARSESPSGLGLGLAIVERLAKILGLKVALRSTLGRGSRFRLAGLARTEKPADVDVAATPAQAPPNRRIAVFDDDEDTLKATGQLLSRWGFAVDLYADWPTELRAAPDVLVCDYRLGGAKTGLDVIEDVRATAARPVPALIVTGSALPELHRRGRELEIPILAKPVRPAQLRSAILAALAGDV